MVFEEYCPWIFRINGVLWNKFFKREFIVKNGIFFNKVYNSEDKLFCIDTFLSKPTAMFLQEQYYCYRQDFANNMMGKIKSESRKIFDIFIYLCRFFDK